MHRIDAPGATVGEQFTEGNPALNIPATEVSDDWLNDVQEELALFIESQGITLLKGTQTQLTEAIALAIGAGAPLPNFTLLNSEAGPTNVTGLVWDDGTLFKAGQFSFDVFRRTDSGVKIETGTAYVTRNTESNTWDVEVLSAFAGGGVTFTMDAAGQVQYSSDTLAGASYVGVLRVAAIIKIKI